MPFKRRMGWLVPVTQKPKGTVLQTVCNGKLLHMYVQKLDKSIVEFGSMLTHPYKVTP
jgi:hypothetical protein